MVLSVIKSKGIIQSPPRLKKHNTWAQVISGRSTRLSSSLVEPLTNSSQNNTPNGEPGNLTTSADQVTPVDHFSNKIVRPYMKGFFAHSILIDITNVKEDRLLFLKEFKAFCNEGKDLYAVSDKIRNDYGRQYAEVKVSPLFYKNFSESPEFILPSFTNSFSAYASLSSSDRIIKVSFTNLPQEYGRLDGGLDQLRSDMITNLERFGTILDSGLAVGTTGVYAGYGYAVLVVPENHQHELTHSLNWSFHPLDYTHLSGNVFLKEQDYVNVFATWASMPPFCRYCHSDKHALLECELRMKATICRLCNVAGHIAKYCPRKNTSNSSTNSLAKKPRKLPQPSTTTPPVIHEPVDNREVHTTPDQAPTSSVPSLAVPPTHTDNHNNEGSNATVSNEVGIITPYVSNTPLVKTRLTRASTAKEIIPGSSQSKFATQSLGISGKSCKSCGNKDHERSNSNKCPNNKKNSLKNLQNTVENENLSNTTSSTETTGGGADDAMDLDDTNSSSQTDLAANSGVADTSFTNSGPAAVDNNNNNNL